MTNLKNISLCNIPVTLNKKGDGCNSHLPEQLRIDSLVLEAQRNHAEEIILAIFFLITKTVQIYGFI